MGRFISNFSTTAEYTTAQSTLETPHVSLTRDDFTVHYEPILPQSPTFTLDFEFPIWCSAMDGKTMIVNNGVNITSNDVINHLKFQTEVLGDLPVVENNGVLYISNGQFEYTSMIVSNNIITFAEHEGGPKIVGYTWL